jgi:pteridine reductase
MMQSDLSGQTALITGSARRLGAAMARALHGAGANVVIHHRHSGEDAAALARELNALRANSALTVESDLLDISGLPDLVSATVAAFGSLDILINNASTFYPTAVGAIREADFDDLIGVNLKAPLFLAQAAAAELRRRRGLVLNLADIHGLKPLKRYPVYSIAKAGLVMLTRSLARELAPEVRVNAIAPGPVLWPSDLDADTQSGIIDQTLLKRAGSPEDIARAALYFAAQAPSVTGQVLAVDGGRGQR